MKLQAKSTKLNLNIKKKGGNEKEILTPWPLI